MSVERKSPADVARRLGERRDRHSAHPEGRSASGAWRFPKAAYMTEIESWRELADGKIEFTMRRLPTAD